MEEQHIINLIKHFINQDNDSFINEATMIANQFEKSGNHSVSSLIIQYIAEYNAVNKNIDSNSDSEQFSFVANDLNDFMGYIFDNKISHKSTSGLDKIISPTIKGTIIYG